MMFTPMFTPMVWTQERRCRSSWFNGAAAQD